MGKRTQLLAIFGMLIAVVLAGCGASGGAGYGGSTTNAGSGNASATSTPTNSNATTGAATVKLAAVTVKGTAKMVLTNDKGLTLYYRTDDTATNPACTGGCLTTWPPLLSPGSAPTAPTGATGTFALLNDSNRSQVEYNGHLLYTFAGDAAAGDANGEGIGNIWFVAAPADLSATSPATTGTAPTATPRDGYTYGGA